MTYEATPFEVDMQAQPDALRELSGRLDLGSLSTFAARNWDRIVITGMGSSYCAGHPTWRSLANNTTPVWEIDTSQLLDTPEVLQGRSLVIATSQSGESGEIVRLLEMRRSGKLQFAGLIGITEARLSTLASEADLFIPLGSGSEATVSTKSYLNSLAIHRLLSAAFTGIPVGKVEKELLETILGVETLLRTLNLEGFATKALLPQKPRVVMVGRLDDAATSIYAGLITKEAAKIPAEGFVGGQFRHGPFELAGPNLSAIFFESSHGEGTNVYEKLITDLIETGSQVLIVGGNAVTGASHIPLGSISTLSRLCSGAVISQVLALNLGRVNGVTPGKFIYGSKVTTLI